MLQTYTLTNVTDIQAPADIVWQQVIDVDIAAFDHPAYFALLDVPKPLNAEVTKPGVGGRRVAYFANGRTFTQTITTWQPHTQYAFTFHASPNFRAGYLLNLADGPFQMISGSYKIAPQAAGVRLFLTSQYQLRGVGGFLLAALVRLVLILFQRYLLRGIKINSEREAAHA